MPVTCRAAIALALVGIVLSSPRAAALPPTGELRMVFDDASRVMNDPATEARPLERLGAVLAIVDRVFAYRDAARLALGPDWDARTPAEQDEFVRLFAELLQRTFVLTMATRASVEPGVEIRYRGESITGDTATVWTTVVARNRQDVPVEYRMVRRSGAWAIQDVVWDGVSLVANYRAQFQRVIRAASYGELVLRMRAKSLEVAEALPFTRAVDPRLVAEPVPPRRAQEGGDRSDVGGDPGDRAAADRGRTTAGRAGQAATMVPPAAPFLPPATPGNRGVVARSDGAGDSMRRGGIDAERPRVTGPASVRVAAVPEAASPPVPRVAVDPPATAASGTSDPRTQSRASGPLRGRGAATYWVQVGAFVSADRAVQAVEALLRRALPVSLDRHLGAASTPASRLMRVRVGPFADRTAATRALHALTEPGAFIVVED
jgi:phospholipid transport system substrate-binding protein